jgi:hypothetical protein
MAASPWKPVDENISAWKPVEENPKEQPGFLDKEIPLTSYGNATLSGVQSIGRGIRGAAKAVGETFNPVRQPGENLLTQTPIARIGRGIASLGKQATQVPAAINDINQSPDPFGAYAKVAQETAGQGVGQAGVALATEGLARGVGAATKAAAPRLYQSALKPSTTLGAPRVARMVDTGLTEKIPVSEAGMVKLGNAREATDTAISDTIAQAPLRTVNKFKVASRLGDTAKKFGTQVNPESDLNAIGESGNEFFRNQPGQIPGPEAQALKQGTYRTLGNKPYGELKGASIESQKALARGLKEELVDQYPELKVLNAKDSRLIDLSDALEKAVTRSANKDPLTLGAPIAYGVTKMATGSSGLGIGAGLLKAALRNPAVKSRLAIALQATGKTISRPGMGASIGTLGGISRLADDRTTQP